eukprot:Gregarina_sp_Poly_1__6725@NODE_361_length_9223_cov_159_738751_g298_i0_p7_GENE_NODE_361_length_9223_cov_159_738751_g298_i0NODE_361_length_9223_cov_159_738751_g298_i0_p7_ORF_typecomplete_len113_score4_70MVL/PF12151_8/0_072Erg28/PF03694_13/0_062Dynactin_p62/PF05502_13/0_071CDC14/PF08045_11/0_13_NODE_361_length_9223_cov_159_738751_g298_i061436481
MGFSLCHRKRKLDCAKEDAVNSLTLKASAKQFCGSLHTTLYYLNGRFCHWTSKTLRMWTLNIHLVLQFLASLPSRPGSTILTLLSLLLKTGHSMRTAVVFSRDLALRPVRRE